jgi:hypothetical protein
MWSRDEQEQGDEGEQIRWILFEDELRRMRVLKLSYICVSFIFMPLLFWCVRGCFSD